MMLAWFSSSLKIASRSPSSASKIPAFASKHDPYRIASSVPWNAESRRSRSLWMSWVPQMNRTEDRPNPCVSSVCLAACTRRGWFDKPR